MAEQDYPSGCRRWDVFEVSLEGPTDGNPFTDQWLSGIFAGSNESTAVNGFYDGGGIYKIRFMPSFEGRYTFTIRASFLEKPASGSFYVSPAAENNNGPVRVTDTWHFSCESGRRFIPVGTTCYVWDLGSQEEIDNTLETLQQTGFNKVRFCIFPKHYVYNFREPSSYPYEGTPVDSSQINEDNFMEYYEHDKGNHFDFHRFNPAHFQRIESCIRKLGELGIEADLILFHPYDRWGFSRMSEEENELYLNYVINRFAAFHNIWWSLANEWDLQKAKTEEQWEKLASVLVRRDPYHHLRSIHNCRHIYDPSRPWITHMSVQRTDLYKGAELTDEYRLLYHKPVIMDELGYEGNLPYGWGNLTGEELTRRAWETALRGGYPGHGETFLDDPDSIWWSHGGKLHGESWKRFAFLKTILEEVPGQALMKADLEWDSVCAVPQQEMYNPIKSQYLFYYSFMRPSYRDFDMKNDAVYEVEIIDTWQMTVIPVGRFSGRFRIELPAKPYILIRMKLAQAVDEKPVEEEELPSFEETTESLNADAEEKDAAEEVSDYVSASQNVTSDEQDEDHSFDAEKEERADREEEPEGGIVFSESGLDQTISIPVPKHVPKHAEKESQLDQTLNIPPVDFSHSINEPPKKQ